MASHAQAEHRLNSLKTVVLSHSSGNHNVMSDQLLSLVRVGSRQVQHVLPNATCRCLCMTDPAGRAAQGEQHE